MKSRRRRRTKPNQMWAELLTEVDDAIRSAPEPWSAGLRLALEQLVDADPLYAPTEFWQPGVRSLLSDLERLGLENFKSWPSARFFFYPRYDPVFSNAMVSKVMPLLREVAPQVPERWFNGHLVGSSEANRDIDIAMAQHDASKLPLDMARFGESEIGAPPQRYHPFGATGPAFGRPYLNYLKIVTAVSRYLPRPVRTVLEIGAGFGVLGEILMSADPKVQYIDIDIPPLSVVAHYYLSQCFPQQTILGGIDFAAGTAVRLEPGGPSACLSSWELPAIDGHADLFVNAFSFQEMEPHVVANYAQHIARLGTDTVVSLNSRRGKPSKKESAIGVNEPVTSDFIAEQFEALGYQAIARLGRPAAPPQAELLILRRV